MNLERFSYAQSLRTIGSSLEARRINTFDLEKYDDTYVLRVPTATQPATGGSFLRKIAQLLGITGNSSGEPSYAADTMQILRYTQPDISRLVAEQQSRHDGLNDMPDAYKLAQVLRVVGDRLDRKEACAFKISVSDHSVSVTYETERGIPINENFTIESLYDHAVQMYLRRSKRLETVA